MNYTRGECLHCHRDSESITFRGLCRTCSNHVRIRQRYPQLRPSQRGFRVPEHEEHIATYAARAAAGQPLFQEQIRGYSV